MKVGCVPAVVLEALFIVMRSSNPNIRIAVRPMTVLKVLCRFSQLVCHPRFAAKKDPQMHTRIESLREMRRAQSNTAAQVMQQRLLHATFGRCPSALGYRSPCSIEAQAKASQLVSECDTSGDRQSKGRHREGSRGNAEPFKVQAWAPFLLHHGTLCLELSALHAQAQVLRGVESRTCSNWNYIKHHQANLL